ncbi:hypothetical protein VTO73DRAFT_1933 [Trametes versicolor]
MYTTRSHERGGIVAPVRGRDSIYANVLTKLSDGRMLVVYVHMHHPLPPPIALLPAAQNPHMRTNEQAGIVRVPRQFGGGALDPSGVMRAARRCGPVASTSVRAIDSAPSPVADPGAIMDLRAAAPAAASSSLASESVTPRPGRR